MAGPGLPGLAVRSIARPGRSAVGPGQAARVPLGRSATMAGAVGLRCPGPIHRPVVATCPVVAPRLVALVIRRA